VGYWFAPANKPGRRPGRELYIERDNFMENLLSAGLSRLARQ
jgi:hypothetical protein